MLQPDAAFAWIGGAVVLTSLLYLPQLRKLRALESERDRLLDEGGESPVQKNDAT